MRTEIAETAEGLRHERRTGEPHLPRDENDLTILQRWAEQGWTDAQLAEVRRKRRARVVFPSHQHLIEQAVAKLSDEERAAVRG